MLNANPSWVVQLIWSTLGKQIQRDKEQVSDHLAAAEGENQYDQ